MEDQDQIATTEGPITSEASKKHMLFAHIDEIRQKLSLKSELRAQNLNAQNAYLPDSHFSKLDSSLKKNTTFVKKLKIFSATQLDALLKDLNGLNLTKYISEVAAALVEAKLKMTDISSAIKLCSVLHQMYPDFSQHFYENWSKILTFKPGDKVVNPSKLRVDLRFYAELVSSGIFSNKIGLPLLGNALTFLINMDKEEHHNISIILSFCRHCGEDYAGLVPRNIRELSEEFDLTIPRSDLLTPEKQANVRSLLRDYYQSLCKHLRSDHKEIQEFESRNRKILQTKGELSQERREKLENLQNAFDKLLTATQNFSEILDESLPDLPEDNNQKSEENNVALNVNETDETNCPTDIWDDDETKRFYTDLPDLHVFLPNYSIKQPAVAAETITEEQLDSDIIDIDEDDVKNPEEETEEADPVTVNVSNKIVLDAFLNSLPNSVNREMIDSSAVEFLMNLNMKHNRRKLIRTLFGVNRTRLDLLPFYARFAATLYPVIPEIGSELCTMLKQDFKYHVRKKDQINIESKIKVVRYIGELVKFSLYSKIEALYCLKVLLHDFSHHHIEMACNLLEVCGRFLFCHSESHQRTKVYLEQMMRKKSVMALDSRYVTQIENAYYFVSPPENIYVSQKVRPPLHQYIRKLLYQDLMKSNTDKILRLMRKLDWENEQVACYTIKCLTCAHNVKYFNIRCLASLLAGLVQYQESVGTHVIDGVLEDIRLGMEVNQPKFNQRRVAMVKYIGELYNYRMIESADIFKVLYSLISFGVILDYSVASPLDPPDHLFRIRLTCVLLETCGQYFNGGSSKKKLDYFLIFFQNYYLFKRCDPIWTPENLFPVEIEYMYKDCLRNLRPKIHFYEDYKQAQKAVEELRKNFAPQLKLYDDSMEDREADLGTIQEQEEYDISDATEHHDDITTTTEDESGYPESDFDSDKVDENDLAEIVDEADKVLPAAPKKVDCPEDDEFLSALDKMVSDNIQDRMRESIKPPQVDISVPMHIKSGLKKTYEQLQVDTSEKDKATTAFVLMLRKGNKQQYKTFEAPVTSELAQNLKNQELALREEKERVKRLTLNITERLEEEDYQEMMAAQQRPQTASLNRERRKYQHPKGAPDADLIFGPKKMR